MAVKESWDEAKKTRVEPAPYGVCLSSLQNAFNGHNQRPVLVLRLITENTVCASLEHVVDEWCQDGSAQDGVTPVAG